MANNLPLAQFLPSRPEAAAASAGALRRPEADQCCRTETSVFRHADETPGRARRKLWQLPHRFHCAVIGTCLTVDDLRDLAPEVGLGELGGFSDYEVHIRFVGLAGEKNPLSERLQALLDRRYRSAVRRFHRLRDEQALSDQWQADRVEGRIAGAFWALVSHPATTVDLASEVYGEIHMLGHQVGAGIRSGLRRLSELEARASELSSQLRHAEQRANEHLSAKQRTLEERDRWRDRARQAEARASQAEAVVDSWERGERVRALEQRIHQLEQEVRHHARRAERAEQARAGEPVDEGAVAVPSARPVPDPGVTADSGEEVCSPDLDGRCILCVGGRSGLCDRYREVVEEAGGEFLHHDGGVEHNDQRLQQLLKRADHVVCPVDCVSHQATRCVKDHCKRSGMPCLFLETGSVTALRRALPDLEQAQAG
ncbi:MAG: DUF2325 domain-containing protein [Thiohalospira sp.]